MRSPTPRLVLLVAFAASLLPLTALCAADIDFNRDIRPILSDRCFFCHGPDAEHRQADLRLDVEADAKEFAIVAGEPASSEAMARITSDDSDSRMPPTESGKTLSAAEVDLLRRWIAEGAPWQGHWAYARPRRTPIPVNLNSDWPRNWIDHFVLKRLHSERLQPSRDADRVTLIRRLSFDLTGLPPTVKEVARFVAADDRNAYEKLVDRLLDSERFGERMAMYWLDLVRYADTVGYHGDQDHSISPYRDWVIDAFNSNMPFDRSTREQLAGDLIAARKAKDLSEGEITDLKIASGYNRLLQTSHEGGVQAKEYLAIYQADRIRNVSAVWLGATMGCAQCHDHKYDPYTMTDFYSLSALLADIDDTQTFRGTNDLPTAREPEAIVLTSRERGRLAELHRRLDQLERSEANADQIASLEAERDAIQPRRTMITVAVQPREIRLLPRGNWLDDSGPVMIPAVPAFLGELKVGARPANRLDFANWLVASDQANGIGGLTVRVQVNRLWYLLFGGGIAKIMDDFGGQGEPPVYPRLLDNLAVEFQASGWDIKHILKLILLSRTYRQSSLESLELRERDPFNRLFARQSRRRLQAEMIRDNALAVSGLLVERIGGPSIRPYQPSGYYRHLNFPKREYRHDADPSQWRRGVYVHWQRQFLHPMLRSLDAPSREECTAQRPTSSTPLAALTLLNDPTMVEAARVFAARIICEGGESAEERVSFAVREALSRSPSESEVRTLARLAADHLEDYQRDPTAAKQLLSVGQRASPAAVDPAVLAAWTSVARVLLNLNEAITRN